MSRLSNSLFQGRPSDKLLVKDTYEVTTGETRNSVFDTAKGIFSDAIGGLKSNTSSPRDLAELVVAAKQGSMTKMELVDRALSAMGSSLPSLLGQAGGTLQNILGETLKDAGFGEVADLGKILYAGAPIFVKGGDVDDTDSLIKFVGAITGNAELAQFFNLGAEAGILSGIASQLVRYGIGDLVDDIAEMAHDESVKNAIFAAIIENAINTSDLKSVNKAIDKLGADGVLAERPNAIAEILAGYRFPEDFDMRNAATERAYLIATLTRISAYWTTKLRNGVPVPHYGNWVALGSDAKTLMLMAEPERTYAISCYGVRPMTVGAVQAELYPNGYVVQR
jgi:hypothetical protein